jgi:hypothetical protein
MIHPQFMIDRQQIEDIRTRMAEDETLCARVQSLTSRRDACLQESFLTEEYANSVYSQHGNYYEIGGQLHRLVSVLGACFVLHDDEQAAARLRDAMLYVASFAVWTGPQNKDRDVPWLSDLSTTRIAVELAFGYDLIYDTLTKEERDTIARAILDKGVMPLLCDWVLPDRRIHALDSMGHNWWSVCIGLAGAAFLPVSDYLPKERFDELIGLIEEALIDFLNYPGCTLFNKVPNYDEQGLFYESVGYFCYGTSELLRYIWHAERYLGRRDALRAALPDGLAEAILSFAYPYTQDGATKIGFLNYGDSAYTANIMPMVRWLRLLGYDSPALAAYASVAGQEEDILTLTMPTEKTDACGLQTLPKTAVYPQTGYVITRSSWQPDATLLAIKSGYTWNHAHADAGSFVLCDKGRPLVIDSGSCSYGDRLYRTYYCKDISHNVLLVDGEGQREEEQIRGSKFPGCISDHYEGDGLLYAQADATGPMAHLCSRMYRNFLWLDHSVLVVIDDVLCHEPRTLQFLLHYDGKAMVGEGCVDIEGDTSAARVYSVHPKAETIQTRKGYLATRSYGTVRQEAASECDYLCFDGENRARVHSLIHVIALSDEQDVQVESLEGRESIGVRLTKGDTVREIWYNLRADGRRMHINSNNTLGAWDTDAYILMTQNTPTENHIFAVSASYVRRDGQARYASFQKKTGYV